MNTAAEVLLIIVSGVLAVFLLVAIAALVKLIQLLKFLRHIAEQAEKIADSAEAATEILRKSAGPLALIKFVGNIIETVVKHKKEN
jgi:type IV secretory pathway component VirB8